MAETRARPSEGPHPETDAALVTQAAAGDDQARAELTHRCRRQVHIWCWWILHDPDLAEDATQDALLQVWRQIGDLREPRAFPSWLYRVALNACVRQQKHESPIGQGEPSRRHDPLAAPSPEDLAVARQDLDRLLGHLRQTERALITLKFDRQMSSREIGAELRLSEGAVRTRLHAALVKLRRVVRRG